MNINRTAQKNIEQKNHAKELKNLRNKHENEIEKINLRHDKNKINIKAGHNLELNSLYLDHKENLANQIKENETALTRLQSSIEQVKNRTQKEKDMINEQHKDSLSYKRASFNEQFKTLKNQNEYMMADLSHQTNTEMKRLQRQIDLKKQEISEDNIRDLQSIKDNHLVKKETATTNYRVEQENNAVKFHKALTKQKREHVNQLATEERNFQNKLDKKVTAYDERINRADKDGKEKIQNLQKNFEKKYEKIYAANQKLLQKLYSNKEEILNYLRQNIKTKLDKEMVKESDPFYHQTKLNPKVSLNENSNGYKIQIDIPEHEAQNVKLTGHKREIKLTFDRHYEFDNKSEDGARQTMKKVETIVEKIPVQNLVDAKTITKKYEDGSLIFDIKFS